MASNDSLENQIKSYPDVHITPTTNESMQQLNISSNENKVTSSEFKQIISDLKQPLNPQSLTVSCRMLRSPSHESVTTDLSLFSVSSIASDALGGKGMRIVAHLSARGTSPNPEARNSFSRPAGADIPEAIWFEEENDLIRSCAVLSSALGMIRSFSTSDITHLPSPENPPLALYRNAVSELALSALQRSGYLLDHPRLEQTSRSCSTWVAVGDISSTSQLPSPHGGRELQLGGNSQTGNAGGITFTASDFIRSVNKKVRQNYIRRKLLTTYRALERLSQSEFNLDRLEIAAATAATSSLGPGPTQLIVPKTPTPSPRADVSPKMEATSKLDSTPSKTASQEVNPKLAPGLTEDGKNLTIGDVERERGKPLSKYERNMMIFNWLHTLDEAPAEVSQ